VIITKKKNVKIKGKVDIKGIYMDWDGQPHPVVQQGKHIGLLDRDSEKYERIMEFLTNYGKVDIFYNPNRGFCRGSKLWKVLKDNGAKLQLLQLDTYYSLHNIRTGFTIYTSHIECLKGEQRI
jgi:hypothetical protein